MNDKPSLRKLHTTFDFNFKFDVNSTSQPQSKHQIEGQPETVVTEAEPRSPRTPTYTATTSPTSSNTTSPFDASKYYSFPSSAFSSDSSSSLAANTTTNSPMLVITPPTPSDTANTTTTKNNTMRFTIPIPPTTPLRWIWTCHLCHTRYPLGTTRRCLIDGHYYCSGVQDSSFQSNTNVNKRHKRRKRGGVVACASEFDYVGWEEYMKWRRIVVEILRQSTDVNVNTSTSTSDTGGDVDGDSSGHKKFNEHEKRQSQRPRASGEIEKKTTNSSRSDKTTTTMVLTLHNNNATTQFDLQGCEKCEYPSECRYEKMSVDSSFSSHCDDITSNVYKTNNGNGSKTARKVK